MISAENVTKMATIANTLTGDALVPIENSLNVFKDLKSRAESIYSRIDNRLDELNNQYLDKDQAN